MIQRGFTIVEIIITITIMGILMILAVVSVNATQIQARDEEREADAKSIALHLETYYQSHGQYPFADDLDELQTIMPDIDPNSLRAPGIENTDPVSLVPAQNNFTNPALVTPQPTTSTYVYQPLAADGTLCRSDWADECRKFNLLYLLESDPTIRQIKSKNQ